MIFIFQAYLIDDEHRRISVVTWKTKGFKLETNLKGSFIRKVKQTIEKHVLVLTSEIKGLKCE